MPRRPTAEQLSAVKARLQANPKLSAIFDDLIDFLQASEYQVILMMGHSGVWPPPIPANPNPGVTGSVEFGLFDYWLNNPPSDSVPLQELHYLWTYLELPFPKTLISLQNYKNLLAAVQPSGPGLVADDGSWFSESTYGGLDTYWADALLYYLYYYSTESWAPFVQTPQTVTLSGASPSQVTIALVGDWGTGQYALGPYPSGPAVSVMQSIVGLNPDYIIHLGDVYYYGSSMEETANLVQMWPTAYAGKSFTLNSNHEMYSGAVGYYSALRTLLFKPQNLTSYFALQYGDTRQQGGPWTIVGLDSAYWSDSPLVMNGSIQSSGNTAQPAFLNNLRNNGLAPQNTIVLTHHNPVTTDGSAWVTDDWGSNLWAQVTAPGALNGTPKAWYWGHVHNGIVYPNPNKMGANMYGRCVGHGALPFGNAWGLQNLPKSQVQAYANTPDRNMPYLMMNGFMLLTITKTGQVTETYYQHDGTRAPWVNSNTYQLGGSADA